MQKLKQSLSKNTIAQSQRANEGCAKTDAAAAAKENVKKTVDQLKKKDILERNRASSMRARAKRKEWIQELQRTVTNVNEANAALQMEVKTLRKEVTRLKTLLVAHKDCPVTKSLQKGELLTWTSINRAIDVANLILCEFNSEKCLIFIANRVIRLNKIDLKCSKRKEKKYLDLIQTIILLYFFFNFAGIILGPKIISVDNSEVLTVPISANGGVPLKRSVSYAAEIPNVSTKKSALSITKNPVILPKMDCGTANLTAIPNATIIKTLPALKIVGVNQFVPEKFEGTKQILIVQNQPRKCEAATRQIIQINPNYEVEHAASKSMRT